MWRTNLVFALQMGLAAGAVSLWLASGWVTGMVGYTNTSRWTALGWTLWAIVGPGVQVATFLGLAYTVICGDLDRSPQWYRRPTEMPSKDRR